MSLAHRWIQYKLIDIYLDKFTSVIIRNEILEIQKCLACKNGTRLKGISSLFLMMVRNLWSTLICNLILNCDLYQSLYSLRNFCMRMRFSSSIERTLT